MCSKQTLAASLHLFQLASHQQAPVRAEPEGLVRSLGAWNNSSFPNERDLSVTFVLEKAGNSSGVLPNVLIDFSCGCRTGLTAGHSWPLCNWLWACFQGDCWKCSSKWYQLSGKLLISVIWKTFLFWVFWAWFWPHRVTCWFYLSASCLRHIYFQDVSLFFWRIFAFFFSLIKNVTSSNNSLFLTFQLLTWGPILFYAHLNLLIFTEVLLTYVRKSWLWRPFLPLFPGWMFLISLHYDTRVTRWVSDRSFVWCLQQKSNLTGFTRESWILNVVGKK